MPVYDYECKECGTTYDILHLTREIKEDIICPNCGSGEHKRLISASAIAVSRGGGNESCSTGNCCGGSCGLN